MMRLLLFILLIVSYLNSFSQQSLLIENFSYAAGTRLTDNGWKAHSGAGTNSERVSANPLFETGLGRLAVGLSTSLATSGEDVNRSFTAVKSGKMYASFLVNVASAQDVGDYFLHFGPTAIDTVFRARVFVRKSANGISFGIAKATRNANFLPNQLEFNKTYLLVVTYSFNTASNTDDEVELSLWDTSNKTATATIKAGIGELDIPSEIGSIALRQGSSASAAALSLDRIIVSTNFNDVRDAYKEGTNAVLSLTESIVPNTLENLKKIVNTPFTGESVTFYSNPKYTDSLIVKSDNGFLMSGLSVKQVMRLAYPKGIASAKADVGLNTTKAGKYAGYLSFESKGLETVYVRVAGEVTDPNQRDLTISNARMQPLATNVTVSGTVTAQFGPTLYIQDATAGIPIFLGNNNTTNYALGDSVRVIGTVRAFNSQIQLGDGTNAITSITPLGKAKQSVVPKIIKINELSQSEGLLIKIVGATFVDKRAIFF